MLARHVLIIVILALAGCSAFSSTKPVEALDDRTGATVASLPEPIELAPSAATATLEFGKRNSFAYIGPTEWDRMGSIRYGLWVHVAPGSGSQADDIRKPGAVTLRLDGEPQVLSSVEAPKLGRDPYKPVVPWGQSAYFDLSVETLKKMAASRSVELNIRSTGGATLIFSASHDPRAALTRYIRGRGIAVD